MFGGASVMFDSFAQFPVKMFEKHEFQVLLINEEYD